MPATYLIHGKAHYSEHWKKADQDEYNKKYYQEHKEKWGVKGKFTSNDKEVKFEGEMGGSYKNLDDFEKQHGKIGDQKWLGEEGDYAIHIAEDGTKILMREDQIVASGDVLKDVDEKMLGDYLDKIYRQAEEHAKQAGIGGASKERTEFYRELNKKIDAQVKGLIAKSKGATENSNDSETKKTSKKKSSKSKKSENLEHSVLIHHGIKGQKWGVRRFRNYDGSYTQAGLKRYDKSTEEYNRQNDRYKALKKDPNASDADRVNAKVARNAAKRKINKDYKHLKQDRLGDEGKKLYADAKRIQGNNTVDKALRTIGSMSVTAATYLYTHDLGDKRISYALAAIGGTSLAAYGIGRGIHANQNRKLRAYYSHTSNY